MPLDDNDRQQIAKYEAKMAPALAELRKWQTYINGVYEAAGESPPYELSGAGVPAQPLVGSAGTRVYKRGEFFNQPMATVVKTILGHRDEDGLGPATDEELYVTMKSGGYDFETDNESKARHKLKTSLGKNPAFVSIPGGYFGLVVKHGRRPKRSRVGSDGTPDAAGGNATDDDSADENGPETGEEMADAAS